MTLLPPVVFNPAHLFDRLLEVAVWLLEELYAISFATKRPLIA